MSKQKQNRAIQPYRDILPLLYTEIDLQVAFMSGLEVAHAIEAIKDSAYQLIDAVRTILDVWIIAEMLPNAEMIETVVRHAFNNTLVKIDRARLLADMHGLHTVLKEQGPIIQRAYGVDMHDFYTRLLKAAAKIVDGFLAVEKTGNISKLHDAILEIGIAEITQALEEARAKRMRQLTKPSDPHTDRIRSHVDKIKPLWTDRSGRVQWIKVMRQLVDNLKKSRQLRKIDKLDAAILKEFEAISGEQDRANRIKSLYD